MFKKAFAVAAIATMASTAMVANAVAQCAPKTVADAGNPCAAANPCDPSAAWSKGDAYGATPTGFRLRSFPGYGINGGH